MTRERADFVLDNIATQVERVRNNSARRRLRRALEKAKAKRALSLEVERLREKNARTLAEAPVHVYSPRSGKMETMRRREAAHRAAGLMGIAATADEMR
jgi:L-lactate utilization protein LutC